MAGGREEDELGKRRMTLASIAAASVLVALKLGVGLGTASLALTSAGIESSGDVVAALLTFFAVRLAGRPADRGHPYGHRRAENLGALGESVILLAGGIVIVVEAVKHLASAGAPPMIRWYQFAVIAAAIVLDTWRATVAAGGARRYESAALRSNAWHFGSDLAGSLAVLVGLLAVDGGARSGDSIAALVVAALILAGAVRLLAINANVLMDRTPAHARIAAEEAIEALGEGIELSRLRLRESAGRFFADVVVSVPAGQAMVEGHRAADLVEGAVERTLPGSDVVVHVEPRDEGISLRERVLAIALAEPLVKEAHDITVFEQGGSVSVSLHLKFPPDVELREAHATAERIERAIRERPGVRDVQTHLEPLERLLATATSGDRSEQQSATEVARLIRELTGREAERVKVMSTDVGLVVFLSVAVDPSESLAAAHQLASELEEEIHRRIGGIAEVVVHTEPSARTGSPAAGEGFAPSGI